MSANLQQLYRQVIMDHFKNPRNKGLVEEDGYLTLHLKNPSCGDDIKVQAHIENGTIKDIKHDGTGCSICCSSASVMSETLKEKTIEEAKQLIEAYIAMIKGEEITLEEELGDAIAYQGVAQFPARFKCATLSWKAISELIEKE